MKENDIVFARTGATVGKSFLIPSNVKNSVYASYLIRVRLVDGVLPKYISYFFQSGDYWQQVRNSSSGIGQPNVNGTKLKKLLVPLAPPAQQKRIVAKIEELFSHIDAGIEALNKAKQLLKQYRQSILKAAVTGELTKDWREQNKDKLESKSQLLERILEEREAEYLKKLAIWEAHLEEWKDDGENGKKPAKPQKLKSMSELSWELELLPDGWGWIRLGELAVDVFDGPFGSNLKSSDYVEDGVRVIRLENIGTLEFRDHKRTFITEEKYEKLKKHTVASGDIIFSSFVADGTRVVVLPQNINRAINKADCFCVRAFGESVEAHYLANYLSTSSTYKKLENQVHGATRPRINTTQLKELEVPICSTAEQREIVNQVSVKFDSIEKLEKEIQAQVIKVEKNKQTILASAFSGELVGPIEGDGDVSGLLRRIRKSKANEKLVSKTIKRPSKKSRGKFVKKPILEVLSEKGEIAVSALMQEAGYELDQVESFYDELSNVSDSIVELRPQVNKVNEWPYEGEVKLKLK